MNHTDCSCPEYRELSRRGFLKAAGGATLAAVSAPAWLPRVALAVEDCSTRDVIVSIYLRGGADGFSLCVPFTESAYYAARPTQGIAPPDSRAAGRALNLDGTFGFPPQFAPLLPAYQAGDLLVVHACGSHHPSRSHFDAQRFMELGLPGSSTLFTGWLGRHLASAPPVSSTPILRAVATGASVYGLQLTLEGAPAALPIPILDDFGLTAVGGGLAARTTAIQDLYNLVSDPLRATAQTTRTTIDLLNTIDFAGYQPAGGAVYPTTNFAQALKSSAALIKADVGVEAIAIDLDGWDTHGMQGTDVGTLANLLTTLAGGLAPFHADIFAGNGRNVTVVVMTEFGRALEENGSRGTDHGHGGALLLLGNNIAGGRVLTSWPGLGPGQLYQGRDLAITIDFRDVLGEIVQKRLGNQNLGFVFPDFTPVFRGVTRPCNLRGDMNCDQAVNFGDIDPFVTALVGRGAYEAAQPTCQYELADINRDKSVDFGDIDPFVNCLVDGRCP